MGRSEHSLRCEADEEGSWVAQSAASGLLRLKGRFQAVAAPAEHGMSQTAAQGQQVHPHSRLICLPQLCPPTCVFSQLHPPHLCAPPLHVNPTAAPYSLLWLIETDKKEQDVDGRQMCAYFYVCMVYLWCVWCMNQFLCGFVVGSGLCVP